MNDKLETDMKRDPATVEMRDIAEKRICKIDDLLSERREQYFKSLLAALKPGASKRLEDLKPMYAKQCEDLRGQNESAGSVNGARLRYKLAAERRTSSEQDAEKLFSTAMRVRSEINESYAELEREREDLEKFVAESA